MTATAGFRNGRVRVLIVDDEPALTDVLSVAVEEAGWRYENPKLPVLMLTARDALEHRLDGLEAGADDHVTKQFSLEEVVLRLRGLLRRAAAEQARTDDSVRVLGDLVLTDKGRAPMIHTVRGLGYAVRPVEDGR
jgi:two-component system OmpR family response regulator